MMKMRNHGLGVVTAGAVIVLLAAGQSMAQGTGGEGIWTPPPAASYPTAQLPGSGRPQGNSFQFNVGEGGMTQPSATTSRLPFIDGHRRLWNPAADLNNDAGS